MTNKPLQKTITLTIIAAVLGIAGAVYSVVALVPSIQELRKTIDDKRASIIVSQQEQSNLDLLRSNLESIHEQQGQFDEHIWSFTSENDFFEIWESLARDNSVKISDPQVAEVTPTNEILNRSVTLDITGSINAIVKTITAIQKVQPLIVINKIHLRDAPTGLVIATIDAQTLWQ